MEPVYFVHISDTHIGPTADFARHGHKSLPCAERIVEIINSLPQQPDFVIHTGDIVTEPHPDSYVLAAEAFARLNVPIYYAVGNHDTAEEIRTYFGMGEHVELGTGKLDYTFTVKGHEFLVIDGRAPDEMDPHGMLSADQLAIFKDYLAKQTRPLTVFGHFPIFPMNSPWLDANMRMIGGEAFHEQLLAINHHLRGYFHGHIHQNMQSVRDGITYTSVASIFAQFYAWPQDDMVSFDGDHPPGFNFVTLLPTQTIVRQHTFPRP